MIVPTPDQVLRLLVPQRYRDHDSWRRAYRHAHPHLLIDDATSWTSVHGAPPDDKKPKALDVAEELLEELAPDQRRQLRLAVADPLAPLITLAFRAHEAVCVEHAISALLARHQQAVRRFESWLAVRPGLQLVFVGEDCDRDVELLTHLRSEVQGALRRVGSLAPDFDVRWITSPPDGRWLEHAMRAHGTDPTPVVPAMAGRPAPGELEHIAKSARALLQHAGERALERAPIHDMVEVGRQLQELLDTFPPAARPGPAEASAGAESPALAIVSARVSVRRFSHGSLEVPLAPITFLSSENASGKTTVVEALCHAYHGRSRLRLRLPEGDDWGGGTSPTIASLRVGTSTRAPAPAASLFLFADDADLRGGEAGETATLAWWPLADATRDQVVGALTSLGDLLQAARRWAGKGEARVDLAGGIPSKSGKDVLLHGRVRERLVSLLQEVEDGYLDPTAPDSAIPADLANTATRLAERGEIDGGTLAQVGWPALARSLLEVGPTRDAWTVLAELVPLLEGAAEQIPEVVLTLLRRTVDHLDARLDRLAHSLEQLVYSEPGRNLEATLGDYLDPDLELAPQRRRPNTSRLIRVGLACRLARWASAGGSSPALVIDEPGFGHDPPAAARVLMRLLRLRRQQDSMRWFEHVALRRGVGQQLVVDVATPPDPGARASHPVALATPADVSPVPVQLMLVSHQPLSLEVAGELEGVELDYALRCHLRKLVPEAWRVHVGDALRECHRRATKALDDDERLARRSPALPAHALRALWRMPDDLPELCAGDLDGAVESFAAVGLFHLAAAVAAERQRALGTLDASKSREELRALGRRLVTWLVWNDLLPASFDNAETGFDLGGVTIRELPGDEGLAREIGPTRLRRIGAMLEVLPPDPLAAREGPAPAPAMTAAPPDLSKLTPHDLSPSATMSSATRASTDEAITRSTSAPAVLDGPARAVDAPVRPRLRDEPSDGIWRIAVQARDPAVGDEIVRRAGALPVLAGGEADLWIRIQETPSHYTFHTEHSPIVGEVATAAWDEGAPLSRAIAYARAARLAERLPEGGTVDLVLWTYGDDPEPSPTLTFSVGARIPQAPDMLTVEHHVAALWRSRFDRTLLLLRDALARSPTTRWLKLWPACVAGASIRFGAVFHHQSGFSVVCDQAGIEWDLDRQPTPLTTPPALRIMPAGPDRDGDEVHLLVGLSAPVADRYRAWQQGPRGVVPAYAVLVEPVGGPSRTSVPADAVVDWADHVIATLRPRIESVRAARRRSSHAPAVDLRIFCAAPTAFAVALGRALNSIGHVVTMDLLAGHDGYVTTFAFHV